MYKHGMLQAMPLAEYSTTALYSFSRASLRHVFSTVAFWLVLSTSPGVHKLPHHWGA